MSEGLSFEDDGWASVTIGGATALIDVYRVYNQLMLFDAQVREEYPASRGEEDGSPGKQAREAHQQIAYLDKLCALLTDLGFKNVSHRAADRFDLEFTTAVSDLGKAPPPAPTPA